MGVIRDHAGSPKIATSRMVREYLVKATCGRARLGLPRCGQESMAGALLGGREGKCASKMESQHDGPVNLPRDEVLVALENGPC